MTDLILPSRELIKAKKEILVTRSCESTTNTGLLERVDDLMGH